MLILVSKSESYELAEETTEEELLLLIDRLNKEEHVNGILVQLPLPAHIDEDKIIRAISPDKDVDGFHPVSVGRLWIGEKRIFILYSGRYYSVIKTFRDHNRWKRMCDCRT